MSDTQKPCTGFFALVAFGTELHPTCIGCPRRTTKEKGPVRWASYVVDKRGFCEQKPLESQNAQT